MKTLEDIVLQDSGRGMTILREKLQPDYITAAAKKLLEQEKGNIIITTGFFVNTAAETDGPPGALCLAKAAAVLGFNPVIVTDDYCTGIFEEEGIPAIYADIKTEDKDFVTLLDQLKPQAMISVERCGVNAKGFYGNCKGMDIGPMTAPIDRLFSLALDRGILTIGIGDGGNEIGMGLLADTISERLDLSPCTVSCDELIVATTSNWGAYGLAAALEQQSKTKCFASAEYIGMFLAKLVTRGFVDGNSGTVAFKVDGFPGLKEMDMVQSLHDAIA